MAMNLAFIQKVKQLDDKNIILGRNNVLNWYTRMVVTGHLFWCNAFSICILITYADAYLFDKILGRNFVFGVSLFVAIIAFLLLRLFFGKMFAPNPYLKITKEHYPENENRELYKALSYAVPKNKKFIVKGFLRSGLDQVIRLHYANGIYIVFVNAFIKDVFDRSPELGYRMIGSLFCKSIVLAPQRRLQRAFELGVLSSITIHDEREEQRKEHKANPEFVFLNNNTATTLMAMWFNLVLSLPFYLTSIPGMIISKILMILERKLNFIKEKRIEKLEEEFFPINCDFERSLTPLQLREVDLMYWALYPEKKPYELEPVIELENRNNEVTLDKCYTGKATFAPMFNLIFNCGLKAVFAIALLAFDAVFYYFKFLGYDYDLPYILLIGFPIGLFASQRSQSSKCDEVDDPRPLDPERYALLYAVAQSVVPKKKFLLYRRLLKSSDVTISYSYDSARGINLVLIDGCIVDAFDSQPKTTAELIKYHAADYFNYAYLSNFWRQVCYVGLHPLLVRIKEGINESFQKRGYTTTTYVYERAYTDFRSDTTEEVTRRDGGTFQLIGMLLIYPYSIAAWLYILIASILNNLIYSVSNNIIKTCNELYPTLPDNPLLSTTVCPPEQYNQMTRKERRERRAEVTEWFRQFI
jgi:hypothetical protein